MNSNKIIREIQYQVAKLEVIELLFWHGKNNQPSLETEMTHNIIYTLRQNLFNASESCLEASVDTIQPYIIVLQHTLVGAVDFLVPMNNGYDATDPQLVFLKELFTNIVSELVNLNIELSNSNIESFQQYSDSSFITISKTESLLKNQYLATSSQPNFVISEVDKQFKNLISKCMGDSEKAERLIKYESQRNSSLDKKGAIKSAITRWERDNR